MRRLRHTFLAGIIVLVPVVISIWILASLMLFLDMILGRVFKGVLNISVPGLGLISLIALILITGFLAESMIGRRFLSYARGLLTRIPLFNRVYEVIENISNSLLGTGARAFRQVVLVPFPNEATFTLGFVTTAPPEIAADRVAVFVPTAPNITTGFYLLFPRESVRFLDMPVQEGIRLVISVGIATGKARGQPDSSPSKQ